MGKYLFKLMESFDIYKSRLFDAIHRDLNSFDSKLQEELSLRESKHLNSLESFKHDGLTNN